jgi:nucleotide-binding universal stress UspA family protein
VNVAEAVPAKEAEFMKSIQADLERAQNMPEITEVEVMVRPGRIRETLKEDLLDVAQPDIVICGARGLSSIKYALLGSISQFLVKTCECDVLVVK